MIFCEIDVTMKSNTIETIDGKVELQIVGLFRMATSTGENRTPRGRKACALLAMLALAPGNRRSRKWIQDKLWSDRPAEQGAASLRQSLAEIRRTLGPERECLQTDNHMLALDRSRVAIDFDTYFEEDTGQAGDSVDLLEGLDIRDPEFEEWLRDQRQQFQNRKLSEIGSGVFDCGGDLAGNAQAATSPYRLLICRGATDGPAESSIFADSLLDSIAMTVSELGSASVLDHRLELSGIAEANEQPIAANTLALQSDIAKSASGQILRVVLSKLPEKSIIWSDTIQNDGQAAFDLDDRDVLRTINQVVNIAVNQFVRLHTEGGTDKLSASLCYSGILHLFRLGKINFDAADKLFARAFEIEPRGIYLAWRAFLRIFLVAEREYSCRETLDEEAFEYMSRALEMEPHNSFVASLSAHVYIMVKRSYVAAYELAERSIQLNRANPLGWAFLGMAKCHLGKSEEGFQHTRLARDIAGSAPYRFQLDGLCCIAASVAGKFDEAIRFGETSHALSPTFAPALRYLTALYLHRGQHDQSRKTAQKLKCLEPDFTFEMLADKAYPTASLHRSAILKSLPAKQI